MDGARAKSIAILMALVGQTFVLVDFAAADNCAPETPECHGPPPGSCEYGGTYPNCNPPPTCQYGGTYPNCNPDPATQTCPYGGTYPNCNPNPNTQTCPDGGTYPNCNPPPSGGGGGNGTNTCYYGGTYPSCNPPPGGGGNYTGCPYGGTSPNCNPPPGGNYTGQCPHGGAYPSCNPPPGGFNGTGGGHACPAGTYPGPNGACVSGGAPPPCPPNATCEAGAMPPGGHYGPPPECMPPADESARATWRPPAFCAGPPPGYTAPNGMTCTPTTPCAPPVPPSCSPGENGSFVCAPPAECAGRIGSAGCVPPPFCTSLPDGRFDCKPPTDPSAGGFAPPPMLAHCAPAASPAGGAAYCDPQAVALAGIQIAADCTSAGGVVSCAPPPGCGGAAFGAMGAAGCAPPDFCKVQDDGRFACTPPQDCRTSPDGTERCFGAVSAGVGCLAHMRHNAADLALGAFAPCADALQHYCPPPPPGANASAVTCGAPPPPPRPCAPGENPFANFAPGGMPACVPGGAFQGGVYVPPLDLLRASGCADPPPGPFPPASPPPAGKVWCPPSSFAPALAGEAFGEWREFAAAKLPPEVQAHFESLSARWGDVTEEELAEIQKQATAAGLFGAPVFDGRVMAGAFADASADPETFAIANFSVGGVSFFTSARLGGAGDEAQLTTQVGGAVVLAGNNTLLEMHNTAGGHVVYRAAEDPYTVDFDLAAGWRVEAGPGGEVVLSNATWSGVLASSDPDFEWNPADLADGVVTLPVDPDHPLAFFAIPPTGGDADARLDLARGVAEGAVGAEALISIANGTAAADVVAYADVQVTIANATTGRLAVDVEAAEHDGKIVVLTIDRTSFGVPLADLAVTIDGETLDETLDLDALVADAAAVTPEGAPVNVGEGLYHVTATETTIEIAVHVEGFSTHRIELTSASLAPRAEADAGEETEEDAPAAGDAETTTEAEPTPTPKKRTPAPGLGLVAVAVLVGLAVRGRRRA